MWKIHVFKLVLQCHGSGVYIRQSYLDNQGIMLFELLFCLVIFPLSKFYIDVLPHALGVCMFKL